MSRSRETRNRITIREQWGDGRFATLTGNVDGLPRWMYNTGFGGRGLKLRQALEIFENHCKVKVYTNNKRIREPWGRTEVVLFSC